MKYLHFWALALGTSILLSPACSRKADTQTELQKAATAFEQPAPAQTPQPAPAAEAAPAAPPTAQQMNDAMAAYKAGNYEDAVARLQRLRSTVAMTPQQRMALQDAVAAVMADMYVLAEKGDPRAIKAVQQYQQMQNRVR